MWMDWGWRLVFSMPMVVLSREEHWCLEFRNHLDGVKHLSGLSVVICRDTAFEQMLYRVLSRVRYQKPSR